MSVGALKKIVSFEVVYQSRLKVYLAEEFTVTVLFSKKLFFQT